MLAISPKINPKKYLSVTLYIVMASLTQAQNQFEGRKMSTFISEGFGTMVFVFLYVKVFWMVVKKE